MSARSSVYEKRILLTKPFLASQSWHQLSVFENKILLQNCLLNEWTLDSSFYLTWVWSFETMSLILISNILRRLFQFWWNQLIWFSLYECHKAAGRCLQTFLTFLEYLNFIQAIKMSPNFIGLLRILELYPGHN